MRGQEVQLVACMTTYTVVLSNYRTATIISTQTKMIMNYNNNEILSLMFFPPSLSLVVLGFC